MSSEQKIASLMKLGPFGKNTALVKEAGLILGWIAGIILIAGLFWHFTLPVRSQNLLRSVNRALVQSGDGRRLEAPVSLKPDFSGMGSWYTMIQSEDRAFVFTFIGEGTFFPCAAVVSPEGTVMEFIPLNRHGDRMLSRISPEVLRLYARRIEGNKI